MKTIAEAKALNKAKGQHFFDAGAVQFFDSRIHGKTLYGGRYFVTSERFDGATSRRYSVREIDPESGRINTIGRFQAHSTLQEARDIAKRLAAQRKGIPDNPVREGHDRNTIARNVAELVKEGYPRSGERLVPQSRRESMR